MKTFKLYFLRDRRLTQEAAAMAALGVLISMIVLNRSFFGFCFILFCAGWPAATTYSVASWKFGGAAGTEYILSLPADRGAIVRSGLSLVLLQSALMLLGVVLVFASGLPEALQKAIARICETDAYLITRDGRSSNSFFKASLAPFYFGLMWASACAGWIPFLWTRPGVMRILAGIAALLPVLGTAVFFIGAASSPSAAVDVTFSALAVLEGAFLAAGTAKFKKGLL